MDTNAVQHDSITSSVVDNLKIAKDIRYENPNISINLLKNTHNQFLKIGDTLHAIDALLELADIYGNQAQYASAYDEFWNALILSEKIENTALEASIYLEIGRIYSFYKRTKYAFKYLNASLDLTKKLIKSDQLAQEHIVKNYLAFTSTYREINNLEMAKKYLDSCYLFSKGDLLKQTNLSYLKFEKAYVLNKEKKHQEASSLMEDIEPWFLKNDPSYLVLVYSYWGDIKKDDLDIDSSHNFYKKALDISKKYNGHIDFSPLIYQKLSKLYVMKGDYKSAYENALMEKNLDAQFFDSRSENNSNILEIKDKYILERKNRAKHMQQQQFKELKQADKILTLQRVILLVTIALIVIIGLFCFTYLRSKHNVEKELIKRNKEFQIQEANALLDKKDKEITTSALQLVRKDEFLKKLEIQLKQMEGGIKSSEINKILKSVSFTSVDLWDEFKLRFSSINNKFYKNLSDNFPDLSKNEQRLCTLIKLNFNSKDISKLLGVSVQSVHTSRYRLRKKLNLSKDTSLEKFLSKF